jgi:hypothetical protein
MRRGRRGVRDLSCVMMIREMSDECGNGGVEKNAYKVY